MKDSESQVAVLRDVIRRVAPYKAIIERAAHHREDSATSTDVAAHWHENFRSEVSDSEKVLKDQAVCFFQIAQGADLGTMIVGRKGSPTRLGFNAQGLQNFADSIPDSPAEDEEADAIDLAESFQNRIDLADGEESSDIENGSVRASSDPSAGASMLGRGIFIAHGKNRKPLEQLKAILDQFKIPYRIAVEEPNLGRPIGAKVREVMQSCNCAILLFTADEEFKDKDGNTLWRPSENVVFELGATGYLYDNKIVILKEEDVTFPTNFRDIGHISFEKDRLDAKSMDVLKELVGFGIVKFST